ncbi:F0F1 ATP synthase subunit gamma [bacterium]|nr:F0F1 ATP synthase subunit gamma [bacterium]
MATLKQIKENLEATSTIKTITSVYQEIAHLRMNQIRQKVLSNREFIEELSQVYNQIKKSYINLLKKRGRLKKKEIEKISFIKRNRRKVAVFLSSNQFFYGTLILDIWHDLLNYLNKNQADLVVIGKIGRYFVERRGFKEKVFYFELDDDNPKIEQIKKIMDFIKNYEEIIVFHGKFSTAISQKPVQDNISGGVTLEKELGEVKNYLFEPSPENILEFFETELMSAFFNQAILEHRLSRYAARMVAMYQATENAKKISDKLKKEQRKLEHQLLNKKQIELFAGFSLWK